MHKNLAAVPERRLLLAGGGDVPRPALDWMFAVPAGPPARVLVFAWASGDPEGSFTHHHSELSKLGAVEIEASPRPPRNWAERRNLAQQIRRADALFFAGGNQKLYADALTAITGLRDALSRFYRDGKVVAGTSAGTAIMSAVMIEGEADALPVVSRRGLGLLSGCIVDQHFLKRSRERRLQHAMAATGTKIGLGIDEDAALACTNEEWLEAIGGRVHIYGDAAGGPALLKVLEPGSPARLSDALATPARSVFGRAAEGRTPV